VPSCLSGHERLTLQRGASIPSSWLR
jgi:hypothetical protein